MISRKSHASTRPSAIVGPLLVALVAALCFALPPRLPAQEPPAHGTAAKAASAPSPLALAAVEIEPAAPGPDQLCQLRVKVRNGGDKTASRLRFTVRIDGKPVPVYDKQLYLQSLPPGATSTVRLYNFWTTETGRPVPADGKLTVRVVLEEASWEETKKEGDVEVSRPLGAVPGLPVEAEIAVPLKGTKPSPSPPKPGG